MTPRQAYDRLLRFGQGIGPAVGRGMNNGLNYARGLAVRDLQTRPYGGKKPGAGRLWQTVKVIEAKESSHDVWTGGLRMGGGAPGSYWGGNVSASVFWAPYVEYGTGQYAGRSGWTIVPKKAKALRWIGADGAVVFAKKVEQRGNPPHPALRPALTTALPIIRQEINASLVNAAEQLGLR